MRTGMLALSLGLLCPIFLTALPSVGTLSVLAVLCLVCLWRRLFPLAFFLFGVCWSSLCAQSALDDRLARQLDGRTLWIEGRVVGLPEQGGQRVRFELQDAQSRRAELPRRLRLTWQDGPALNSGEHWRLAVNLKRPQGLLNPHAADAEAMLLARGIGGLGSVKDGVRTAPASGAWRDGIRQRLLATPANGREAALAALVLGDGAGLAREDWNVLQATGTVHLLVISGQHIGLLAGLVYGLVVGLFRLGWWPQRQPWLPWACGLAFAAALGYGVLAGFQVPVQRACIMLAVVLLWRLRFRHLGVAWPLLVALNGVLLFEPLAALLPGFWLSFGAVAVLVMVLGGRLGRWPIWTAWGRMQWFIAIGLLPPLLALGLPVSLSAPLANLVAVPWLSILVLPLALAGTLLLPLPLVGEGLLWLAGGLLGWLFDLLGWMAAWRPAWIPPALPLWSWLLVCLGAFLLLLPAGLPMRQLGWPLLLLAGFTPRAAVPPGQVDVWQLDVGQGQAFVLRTRDHTLLYDAGPARGDVDLGERVVVPTLLKLGIRRLDLMLISHAHADHAGGALAVQRGLPVRRVVAGEPDPSWPADACASGEVWVWDEVRFSLWQWQGADDSNQHSCVLKVEASGETLLLAGDIDRFAEQAWLQGFQAGPVDWLQAPHHGSRTSSSAAFLDVLRPRGVLVSRGRHNGFGHPSPLVTARYAARHIAVYDSAVLGAVHLRLGSFGSARGERERGKFWRDPT
ncbi:DNA internalization-related competence protein ComEC/Rec2 [Pseudomonas sp. GD04058]|uniref:DNA internalization-related competence protein ComEC/Rec2 n=1 Tax=Pseudomonas sp. GD04058 TaxID=2975429 RepID=UPI00244788C6|nr:DNA internalization-related competence protein ComEC/Rec2 [Pseudomonas sp. GD04058]MDG9885650.1 DNA internalization-related competence protein ComEC/Rec2 [Pseudomonas sp. GD04058]